jgi:ribonuclease-3
MNIDRVTTEISTKLKYTIKDKYLLLTALTRQSAISENEKSLHAAISSQRLEFIGDSVLGLIITKQLYLSLTTASKDQLQRIKQSIISNKTLGKLGHELDLERFLVVGKSEKDNINSNNKAIADLLEALIGVVYLDSKSNFEITEKVVLDLFMKVIKEELKELLIK